MLKINQSPLFKLTNCQSQLFVASALIDFVFITYWITAALDLVPAEYMYSNYRDPQVVAWNWSFFPLDILVSLTGIMALHLWRKNSLAWLPLMTVSLSLMFCAGLQAIAYWAIRGEFDPSWWIANIVLIAIPLIFFPTILDSYRNQVSGE